MREKHRIPFRERILCSPAEAGEALDKGKTAIFEMIACGRLRSVKHGTRRHIYVESVLEAAGVHFGSPETTSSDRADVRAGDLGYLNNIDRSNG
jgi:hypothetical protein